MSTLVLKRTTASYDDNSYENACSSEFGSDWQLVDFTYDLVPAIEPLLDVQSPLGIDGLLLALGIETESANCYCSICNPDSERTRVWVSDRGDLFLSYGSRRYFVERHKFGIPSCWGGAYGQVGELSLGAWYGTFLTQTRILRQPQPAPTL